MNNTNTQCARCGANIKIKRWTMNRQGKIYPITTITNGFTITKRLGQLGVPVCRECYGIIVDLLRAKKELIYRNDKGQIQCAKAL